MKIFKRSKEQPEEPNWYKEIDWKAPDSERQVELYHNKICDELKNRPGFGGIFHKLTVEFAAEHPGSEGDGLFTGYPSDEDRRLPELAEFRRSR